MCASPSTAPGFFNHRPQSGAELSAFELGLPRSMALGVPPPTAWHDPNLGGHLHASAGPGSLAQQNNAGSVGTGGGTTPSSVASHQSVVGIKQDLSALTSAGSASQQTNHQQSAAVTHHTIKEDLSAMNVSNNAAAHHAATASANQHSSHDMSSLMKGSQSQCLVGSGSGGSSGGHPGQNSAGNGGSTTPSSQANSSHSQSSNSGSQIDPKQNIECVVCGDKSSGKHYGQFTCEGKSKNEIIMKKNYFTYFVVHFAKLFII